jgi:hypothetical protein
MENKQETSFHGIRMQAYKALVTEGTPLITVLKTENVLSFEECGKNGFATGATGHNLYEDLQAPLIKLLVTHAT